MARHLIASDLVLKRTKPLSKTQRISDGDGLYLLLKPDGAKWWRFDYSIAGKRKTLSLGVYPDTSLAFARQRADEARVLVAAGTDPSDVRKAKKAHQTVQREAEQRIESGLPAVDSFEEVAREWFEKHAVNWSDTHSIKIIRRLEVDVFPWIGKRTIGEIEPPELLGAMRRIEARGALETAHRALANCGQVFRYAVATGRAKRDPSSDLRGALPPYRRDKHFAAITEPQKVGELMRDIEGYQGSFVVKCAFRLSPLLFVRPGELRKMEWADVNLDAAEWIYFVTKTKTNHLVPLCTQAVACLREIQPLTGQGKYVFPGERDRDRPMSDNAIRSALRRMGWSNDEMTPHGFRAMASTILDNMGYKQEWLERQLAHEEPNKVKAAYKRDTWRMYLPERTAMMQAWADYLDKLKEGAVVVPFRA